MLDFLKECGISDETIEKINLGFAPFILEVVPNKKTEIINNIKLLTTIGVTNVEDLLFEDITVFFQKPQNIYECIINYGEKKIAKMLNENPANVNILFPTV